MPAWLTYLVYSFFHGRGAIALVVAMVFRFFFTFVMGRLSSPVWIMAAVMNFPTVYYLMSLNADYYMNGGGIGYGIWPRRSWSWLDAGYFPVLDILANPQENGLNARGAAAYVFTVYRLLKQGLSTD
jgi:hypothetical protein